MATTFSQNRSSCPRSVYKRLFSHLDLVRDLLVGFVREPWVAAVDFATLEKYPTEFIRN